MHAGREQAGGDAYQHVSFAAYSGWVAWTPLGLGASGIWLAVMFVSIYAPVMVTGTAET